MRDAVDSSLIARTQRDGSMSAPGASRPSRRLLVIGIGSGDPAFVTMQAVDALNAIDVVVLLDKDERATDLLGLRLEVLRRYRVGAAPRAVHVLDGRRDPDIGYSRAVARWHEQRVIALERALLDEVGADETSGILVWGDPALYDSTLRIVDQINGRGHVEVEHKVIPAISSVQVLAARHRIPLNRVGGAVHITTGRLLRDGLPAGVDDVVVMLDADVAFTTLIGHGFEIFWGAYLGTSEEILVAGVLDDVADEIVAVRAAARARRGWIFDTYLLRRRTE
jgi:precorrin-6A synthase